MNVKRLLPFLDWLPLRLDTFKADLTSGVTVALVAIPQALAYAQLAGLPAYYGLYAALIPTVVGALFGSSGVLSTG
ncbi:MAG: SulP family inorganic anion transporter, partial [Burkholderiales bacterium]